MKEKSTFSILDRMFLCFLAVVMVLSTIVISANKIVVYAVLSEQAGSFFGEEDISYAVPMTVRAKQKANTYDINGNIEPKVVVGSNDISVINGTRPARIAPTEPEADKIIGNILDVILIDYRRVIIYSLLNSNINQASGNRCEQEPE